MDKKEFIKKNKEWLQKHKNDQKDEWQKGYYEAIKECVKMLE